MTIGSSFGIFSNEFLASPPKDSIEPQEEASSKLLLAVTSDKMGSLSIYNPLFYADITLPKDAFQSWWYKREEWYWVDTMCTDYEVCNIIMVTCHDT